MEERIERNDHMDQMEAMVHVRFEGRSWRIAADALAIDETSSDREVLEALARYLDVAPARLAPYVVEHHERGNITVRPEAVFG